MLSSLTPIPFSNEPQISAGTAAASVPVAAVSPTVSVSADATDLFTYSPLAMFYLDTQTLRFLDVNDAAISLYGWSHEEFVAMSMEKLLSPGDVAAFQNYCRRVLDPLASGDGQRAAWRHDTKGQQTVLVVEVALQSVQMNGRAVLHATIIDRSVEVHSEEENRELADVLNRAADAIIICDFEREVLFWNEGAERAYGWSADEAVGRKVDEILGMTNDMILGCMSGLMVKGEWRGQLSHLCKKGTPALMESRWTLARDEQGQPKSMLLINTDITESRKMEMQFLRTQRLESLGTLASGIAHDLNNILSPIMMATGILKDSLGADERKMLEIIEDSAVRGAGIVKQVLTFARGVEGERVMLQPKHLISEMAKVMVQTFPKNVDIQTNFAKEPWMVNGDATQIHQVLLNLCVNARDAMGEKGGALRVSCANVEVDADLSLLNPDAKVGPHVCFSVADTGSGMTKEVMKKIFDPFFTTKEQGKGTGLGLATVIGIIKSHKGFLLLDSELGVGTTFRVYIPADREAKAEKKRAVNTAELRGQGEQLLIVDDEATIREAVVATLSANGYTCFTAEDGTDALALYFERKQAIALVITDLHMGMMDGIALTRSIRRVSPEAKIVISSGHIDKESQTALNSIGVQDILEKPYTAEKLLRCVKAILHPKLQVKA